MNLDELSKLVVQARIRATNLALVRPDVAVRLRCGGGTMRLRMLRQMPGILSEQAPVIRPSELTPRDYVIMLLNVAASIEHALMVQYLYAAYSLGGAQVPIRHRPMVERWRDIILTIAREEMGHLLTVQNLIFLLGGAPTLDREDYPFDTPFYPFQFRLEP